jgi:hypothetical protein
MNKYRSGTHELRNSACRILALITMAMKNSVFWEMTLCSLVKVKRRFGGTYRVLLQGSRILQQEAGSK